MFLQLLGECPVEQFGVLRCEIATSNAGLVRDDNQQITQFLKDAECFGYAGQQFQLLGLINVAEIDIDGTVPVKENRFIHEKTVYCRRCRTGYVRW